MVQPRDCVIFFQIFLPIGSMYRITGLSYDLTFMIWHYVIWSIQKSLNSLVFLSKLVSSKDLKDFNIVTNISLL